MSQQGKVKEWIDISNEEWREYLQPVGNGAMHMRIHKPVSMTITPDGHEIKDEKGVVHEIPRGWLKVTYLDKKYAEPEPDQDEGEKQPPEEKDE
jgi:hypothetical protein